MIYSEQTDPLVFIFYFNNCAYECQLLIAQFLFSINNGSQGIHPWFAVATAMHHRLTIRLFQFIDFPPIYFNRSYTIGRF